MREIKFRAYDGMDWIYSSTIEYVKKHRQWMILDTKKDEWMYCSNPEQFTGLTDKNGVEIYEGDVVRYKGYRAMKKWWSTAKEIPEIEERVQEQRDNYYVYKDVIEFKDGGFKLGYQVTGVDLAKGQRFERGQTHHSDFEEKQWDFEVIGNIHENPELLEST